MQIGQMGSSCDGPQCQDTSLNEDRKKRSASDFYDLLEDLVDVDGGDEKDDGDVFGRVIFTLLGQEPWHRRSKRNVSPAANPSRFEQLDIVFT